MRFSKEDLAKMVVELIDNVCNYHVNCFESQQKCPLYQNCGFWSEVKLEIQDWLNVGGEDKMQFSKEELAEIIVNMYHDVCDNCADCNKCPLSANCEYYTSISIELEKFALEEAISQTLTRLTFLCIFHTFCVAKNYNFYIFVIILYFFNKNLIKSSIFVTKVTKI